MNEFKKMRTDAGVTQAQVAEALKYENGQYVSNWERNVSEPPYKACKTLSKLYKVPLNELVDVLDEVKLRQFIARNKRQKKQAGL